MDGKWHYTCESNLLHDKKRNEYLIKQGWKIFRISIDEVNNYCGEIETEFLYYLNNYTEKSSNRFYTI